MKTIEELIEKYEKPSIFKLNGTNIFVVDKAVVLKELKQLKESLDQGITEQQALNKLAERFPMTTDQIIYTLEMSQAGVNHEPVEVPEFVDYLIKKCRKSSVDLTFYGFIKVNSDIGFEDNQSKEGEFVIWLTKKGNEEILARAWFNGYTVAKEPLYIMPVPCTHNGTLHYCLKDDGEISFRQGNAYKFTKDQIGQYFTEIEDLAVPVEEEE